MSKLPENYIENKISECGNYIRISYYELRVKYDLTKKEADDFIIENRLKLESNGYDVYLPGARFYYDNADRIVEMNEILIAIKRL